MMGEPPVEIPLVHVNPITEAVVTVEFICKPIGALGTDRIIAPLPADDCADSPYTFVEVRITIMLSPCCRLNGDYCKTTSGIEHCNADTIAELDPLQYVSYST